MRTKIVPPTRPAAIERGARHGAARTTVGLPAGGRPAAEPVQAWTAEHARVLTEARVGAGLDQATLARQNTISLKQLRELEAGGHSTFYSERIKYQVGKRLLRKLGVDWEPKPPDAERADADADAADADAADATAGAESTAQTKATTTAKPPTKPSAGATRATRIEPRVRHATAGGVAAPATPPRSNRRGLRGVAAALFALLCAGVVFTPWQLDSRDNPALERAARPREATELAAAPNEAAVVSPAVASPAAALTPDAAASDSAEQAPPTDVPALDAGPLDRAGQTVSMPARDRCVFPGAGWRFAPTQPRRPGDYVYLTAVEAVELCVEDATGQLTSKALKTGSSLKVTGTPPFKLNVDGPERVVAFYRGQRVHLKPDAEHWVLESTNPTAEN